MDFFAQFRSVNKYFICLIFLFGLMGCYPATQPSPPTFPSIETSTPASTLTPSATPAVLPAPSPQTVYIISLTDSGYAHLFAYSPQFLPLTRLTDGEWDDITPALSPDGRQVAFASRRNGYWDLYLLSLETGEVTRLTDTPEYDAAPSWSPDGRWLVYETYLEGNLELSLISTIDLAQIYRLTNHPAADHSPAWSPQLPGRQIAFVSNRSGENEIWIADLDRTGEALYSNVSRDSQGSQGHPAWSPDGEQLAWATASYHTGLSEIYVWDSRTPEVQPRLAGSGDWPVWMPDGSGLATRLCGPNQTYLTAYSFPAGELNLPPLILPGTLRGLAYGTISLPSPLPAALQEAAAQTPTPLYLPSLTLMPDIPGGRQSLVEIQNVQVPYPRLHDMVDESFNALRIRTATETGWDALASLENAFVPLTTPLDPGMSEDWLYTGRAFALNTIFTNAGWIVVVREDFGQQTYWRVYLRTRAQDGSQGEPLHQIPWDFNTRYSGDPRAYEQGGSLASFIPTGYWLDFTALALQYDWQRLPALSNWRTYYAGAQFTEFVLTGGLDWHTAMLEIYPPDVLVTPTVVIPPTRTPTRTPWGYQTPTPTLTPTPRPTFTPFTPTP